MPRKRVEFSPKVRQVSLHHCVFDIKQQVCVAPQQPRATRAATASKKVQAVSNGQKKTTGRVGGTSGQVVRSHTIQTSNPAIASARRRIALA